MKLVVKINSLRWFLRWAQVTLFAAGILLLGYCGFILADAWIFQHRQARELARMLENQRSAQAAPAHAGRPAALAPLPPAIGPDGLIGSIEIQRLGLSVVVVEGTGKAALARAAGHIVGTGLPGQPGNVGIAAHRDTFFLPLRNIQPNDTITLTTLRGAFQYRVVSTQVVLPDDVAVLDPDGNEILTLVTCYPFYFIGSAPQRFIVRAERVS